MIIWINGFFGSGKTTIAHELAQRIPDAFVFDPEETGFFIRKNIPFEMQKDDFQDFALWRNLNYSIIKSIENEYDGIIIIPMTLVSKRYFDEIITQLRLKGISVHHYSLLASKETIHKRLRKRGDLIGSWAAKQYERCAINLNSDTFGIHIKTDSLTIQETIEFIAKKSKVELLPDKRNWFQKIFFRFRIWIQHIRLFN